jgi:hypothetical protein
MGQLRPAHRRNAPQSNLKINIFVAFPSNTHQV